MCSVTDSFQQPEHEYSGLCRGMIIVVSRPERSAFVPCFPFRNPCTGRNIRFGHQFGLKTMFLVLRTTLVIALAMLLSPYMTQAIASNSGLHRHIEVASILRSSQERVGGAAVLSPLLSTQRFLRQVSLDQGVFLVAKRHIKDPRFKQTVILITGHDSRGSIGLVVNRRSEVPVSEMLPEWAGLVDADAHVYYGGPVEIDLVRFLIRSSRPLDIGHPVLDDVYIVASKLMFDTFIRNHDSANIVHAYIGYAGWAAGQLEHEVDRGDWYVVQGNAEKLFDSDPETLWQQFNRALSGNWVYYQD